MFDLSKFRARHIVKKTATAAVALVALGAVSLTGAQAAPITIPTGLNPGDTYRLAFVTRSFPKHVGVYCRHSGAKRRHTTTEQKTVEMGADAVGTRRDLSRCRHWPVDPGHRVVTGSSTVDGEPRA